MGIGQRKPVRLIQIAVTIDADGRNIETEGQSFKTWAEISGSSGGRDYLNGQTQLSGNKTFVVRFKFDKYPNADWKVQYLGKDWTVTNIQRVNEKLFYWSFNGQTKSDV